MDSALTRLLWLRLRGGCRQRWRQLRSWRGAGFMALSLAVIGFLIYNASAARLGFGPLFADSPEQMRAEIALYTPYLLLAGCLLTVLTASGPAIHFSAAEINWLVAGPFRRRGLILYKLCFYVAGALLSSALVALLVPAQTLPRAAVFCGTFLTMCLIQLLVAAIGLGWQTAAGRRALPALLALLALAAAFGLTQAGTVADLPRTFAESPVGRGLLWPFRAVTEVFLASDGHQLLLRSAVAVALLAALVLLIVLFDARALEQAADASRRRTERWLRFRRSGQFWPVQRSHARSAGPPPALCGVGPIAWRQTLSALRTARKAVLVFLLAPLLAGPLAAYAGDGVATASKAGLWFFFAVFVLPRTLLFDFRGDREMIGELETLPLPAWAICCGQLAVPAVLSSVALSLPLLGAALFGGGQNASLLLALVPFTLPFSVLLFQVENLLFLLFPAALVPVGRADFDFLGRTLVETAVKIALLMLACALAAAAAVLGWRAAGSAAVAAAAAWLALGALTLAGLALLAVAFRRFDPARL